MYDKFILDQVAMIHKMRRNDHRYDDDIISCVKRSDTCSSSGWFGCGFSDLGTVREGRIRDIYNSYLESRSVDQWD